MCVEENPIRRAKGDCQIGWLANEHPGELRPEADCDKYVGRLTYGGVCSSPVIMSFRDKRTAAFARGDLVCAFQGIERQAYKRLEILAAATSLADLRALPSNRIEGLHGDRARQFSIRINLQWRICFEWPEDATGPSNVEIVDYH